MMYPSSKSNLVVLIEKAIQLMSSSEESCQNSAEIVEDPLSPPAQQNDENTLAEDTSPVIQQPIKVPCLSNINNEELVVDPLQFLAAEYALKKNEQMSQSLDSYCQPSFGMFSNWGQLHNLSNLISGPSVPSSSGESTLPHPRSIRRCQFEGCQKYAQGATKLCIAHGGGRRCTFPGCSKGARDRLYCAAHGGGRRCSVNHCSKSAVGGTAYCTAHGGGKRCQYPGCCKSSQSNTKYCVRHGGGKSCQFEGCTKVARGRTDFCAAHGGGVRCRIPDCPKLAVGPQHLCRAHTNVAVDECTSVLQDHALKPHELALIATTNPSLSSSDDGEDADVEDMDENDRQERDPRLESFPESHASSSAAESEDPPLHQPEAKKLRT